MTVTYQMPVFIRTEVDWVNNYPISSFIFRIKLHIRIYKNYIIYLKSPRIGWGFSSCMHEFLDLSPTNSNKNICVFALHLYTSVK